MILQQARDMAQALLLEHGLIEWRFDFDSAVRRAGRCSHRRKLITLSAPIVELNDEQIVKDTLLHEIAHAIAGRDHGHDNDWRRIAVDIGCNGQRCYGDETKLPPKKYTATCPNGHSKQKSRIATVSCGKCSSVFDHRFLMTYTLNA